MVHHEVMGEVEEGRDDKVELPKGLLWDESS